MTDLSNKGFKRRKDPRSISIQPSPSAQLHFRPLDEPRRSSRASLSTLLSSSHSPLSLCESDPTRFHDSTISSSCSISSVQIKILFRLSCCTNRSDLGRLTSPLVPLGLSDCALLGHLCIANLRFLCLTPRLFPATFPLLLPPVQQSAKVGRTP